MGFPVAYSELLLPRVLLHLLLLLGYIRRFLLWAFRAVGLGDLLDAADDSNQAHYQFAQTNSTASIQFQSGQLQHRRPEFRPVSAMAIAEALPVVRYDELLRSANNSPSRPVCCDGGCAVCLAEFGGGDEVRRLSNCRHVFHRGCLDRWMEHEQRTCPLCRKPLLPDEVAAAAAASPWPSWSAPEASDYDFSFSPLPSPVMLLPQQLLMQQ